MTDSSDELATRQLLGFVRQLDVRDLPAAVYHQAKRSLVDSVGCIVGGSRHDAVAAATGTLSEFFGPPQATLLGQGTKADVLHAPLVNALAGASYSFFDSYSTAHLHAGVVHAAVLLALSERIHVSGADFLSAYAAGLEVACRLTKGIALPPAEADVGWSIGGIVSGVSSAVAAGKLLGLDENRLLCALGIAASGAAGTRIHQGAMTAGLIFGHAAQNGIRSALLAADGFTSPTNSLGGRFGYAPMFSSRPMLDALTQHLGESYELQATTFKPYPTDIAVHPSIDAMLQLKADIGFAASDVRAVRIDVSELAATFCDRPAPANDLEAKFSLQHWVGASAVHGRAGLREGTVDAVADSSVRRLGGLVTMRADSRLAWDAAVMTVELYDGRHVETVVDHCLGSSANPMSDDALDAKFVDQAELSIGRQRASRLVGICRSIDTLPKALVLAQKAR